MSLRVRWYGPPTFPDERSEHWRLPPHKLSVSDLEEVRDRLAKIGKVKVLAIPPVDIMDGINWATLLEIDDLANASDHRWRSVGIVLWPDGDDDQTHGTPLLVVRVGSETRSQIINFVRTHELEGSERAAEILKASIDAYAILVATRKVRLTQRMIPDALEFATWLLLGGLVIWLIIGSWTLPLPMIILAVILAATAGFTIRKAVRLRWQESDPPHRYPPMVLRYPRRDEWRKDLSARRRLIITGAITLVVGLIVGVTLGALGFG